MDRENIRKSFGKMTPLSERLFFSLVCLVGSSWRGDGYEQRSEGREMRRQRGEWGEGGRGEGGTRKRQREERGKKSKEHFQILTENHPSLTFKGCRN